MGEDRLQKILARAGVASRRQAEDMIREGRVVVNGKLAKLGQSADLAEDAIKVDGKRIQPPRQSHIYILVNKPPAVVSTRSDPEGRKTLLDLIPTRYHRGLVTVGRLDFETEGLILLTDDGDFAQRVAHPRHGCTKTYEVKVKGTPNEAGIDRLRGGIVIDRRRTAPARIESQGRPKGARDALSNTWWRVILNEGRSRQIREMFHRIGHPVQRLRRVAIGPLKDPRLLKGSWRVLSAEEVSSLVDSAEQTARSAAQAKSKSKTKSKAKGATKKDSPAKDTRAKGSKSKSPSAKGPGKKSFGGKGAGGKGPGKKSFGGKDSTARPAGKGRRGPGAGGRVGAEGGKSGSRRKTSDRSKGRGKR